MRRPGRRGELWYFRYTSSIVNSLVKNKKLCLLLTLFLVLTIILIIHLWKEGIIIYSFFTPESTVLDIFLEDKFKYGLCEGNRNQTYTTESACPETPPCLLGYRQIILNPPFFGGGEPNKVSWPPSFDDLDSEYAFLEQNLKNKNAIINPISCSTPYPGRTIAIIVPYRNRPDQLKIFLKYLLPVLIRQQLKFKIYVIEQFGAGTFNRAKLLNAGYDIAFKEGEKLNVNFDCYFFHDVDLILENDKNIYECSGSKLNKNYEAKHFLVAWSKYNYRFIYKEFFGGITGVTKQIMQATNGLSNEYWGWGGEDDDFYYRIKKDDRISIFRPGKKIARYKMIPHKRDKGNEVSSDKDDLVKKIKNSGDASGLMEDGLSNLEYEVIERSMRVVFERIVVDVGSP